MREVVFLDEATAEALHAAIYYDTKAEGLGVDFTAEVEQAVQRSVAFPEAGTLLDAHTRRHMVRRFPFGILYRLEPERIVVVAVMDLRREPDYWRDRI